MSDGGKGDKRRPEDMQAFSEGYGRVFGDAKPQRGKFVWDDKQRKFVPADEYYANRAEADAPFIQPDIQPYQSMATGEMIGGRRQHREHLKANGLIEVGNETKYLDPKPRPQVPDHARKEMIARQVYEKLRY
jgi:hypothetical protein